MSRVLIAALACAVLAAPASAVTYKWTDGNGRVVYSDIPPTGNVKYETVGANSGPANPKALQDLAAKDLEIKKRQQEAADKDKKADEKRGEIAKLTEQCQRAESNVRALAADQVPIMRFNERGEAFYIDAVQRRRERNDIEAWMRQNCNAVARN